VIGHPENEPVFVSKPKRCPLRTHLLPENAAFRVRLPLKLARPPRVRVGGGTRHAAGQVRVNGGVDRRRAEYMF
jgi:hypothetical protein